jgi:serine/threonine protein kinase
MKHALEQILEKLAALHKAGFIHRDIKPENVVVKRGSDHINLFLCDFSISLKKNDENCSCMKALKAGTHGFIAP